MIFATKTGEYLEAGLSGFVPDAGLDGRDLISGGTGWIGDETSSIAVLPVDRGKFTRRKSFRNVYLTNPWARAAVNATAKSFKRMPAKVSEPAGGRHARSEAGLGAELEAMIRSPFDGRSGQAQQSALMIDRLVEGNALLRIHRRNSDLGILGFEQVAWSRVTPHKVDGQIVYAIAKDSDPAVSRSDYWSTDFSDQTSERVLASDVIHFGFGHDSNGIADISPFASMGATVALYDAALDHVLSFLGKGARLSGAFEVDPHIDLKVFEAVKKNIAEAFAGTSNAGQIAVTAGKFHPISQAPDHGKLMDLAEASALEIAAVLGVPPPLMGKLEHANYSNIKELREHANRDVVGVESDAISGDFIAQLAYSDPRYQPYRIRFESGAILKPSPEATAGMIPHLSRVHTVDEIRADLYDLPPLPDGLGVQIWNPNGATEPAERESETV